MELRNGKNFIILRGNSGSGKTQLRRNCNANFGENTMLISQDVIRREMLGVKDGPKYARTATYKRAFVLWY